MTVEAAEKILLSWRGRAGVLLPVWGLRVQVGLGSEVFVTEPDLGPLCLHTESG